MRETEWLASNSGWKDNRYFWYERMGYKRGKECCDLGGWCNGGNSGKESGGVLCEFGYWWF